MTDLSTPALILALCVALGCAVSFLIWSIRDGGLSHLVRAVRLIVASPVVPKWLKAMVVFGCLPILGPFDEVVLGVAALLLWLLYREELKFAWRITDRPVSGN